MRKAVFDRVRALPKVELHVHLEGSISPASKIRFARRNGLPIAAKSANELAASYEFYDLVSFLRAYNEGLETLHTERDYFELTSEYLAKSHSQNVCHAEMHFDPQMHLARGISYGTFMPGILRGMLQARDELGITSGLILAFYWQHEGIGWQEAYEKSVPYNDDVVGVGIYPHAVDGYTPAVDFMPLVDQARARGHKVTAHCNAGQPESHETIRACIHDLGLERIDHGVDIVRDAALEGEARGRGICFTVCPIESARISGPRYLQQLRQMLDHKLTVTVNSDDPGYFLGRHIGDIYEAVVRQEGFSAQDLERTARNAILSAWIDEHRRSELLAELDVQSGRYLT